MKRHIVALALTLLTAATAFAAESVGTTPAKAPATVQAAAEYKFPDAFAALVQRARDYEQAYAEQGKKSSPWLAKAKIVNEEKFGGWLKKGVWNFPPMPAIDYAPQIGGTQFKLACIMASPLGWQMVLEPRDKKLAGFEKVTIAADQKDITAVEIK